MPYRSPEALTADSGAESPLAAVRAVRESVSAMRRALLGSGGTGTPALADIESSMPELERAIQLMRDLSLPSGRDREPLLRELVALRAEGSSAAHLAHTGSAFFQGLARLLGAASGGYTPAGEGAPLQTAGTLLLRG